MSPVRPDVDPAALVTRRRFRGIVSLACGLVAVLAPVALRAAGPMQAPSDLFLPSLQSDYQYENSEAVIHGQEGFGAGSVDARNLSDAANDFTLDLTHQSGGAPASLLRQAEPKGVARFDLESESSLEGGYYSGRLRGSEAFGAIAHLRWPSGATAAYEAAPAGRDFILPLVARDVYSHTSIIYALNADTAPQDNAIDLVVHDPENGEVVASTTCNAGPGENCTWDTVHSSWVFGSDLIGSNAPTGGWLGPVWIRAGRPAAVMVYGDEMAAQGTGAWVARPASAAAPVQVLPVVRANFGGDSLIAVANAHDQPVEVTIQYQGATFSASGAGESFSQRFSIPRRGSAIVDLSERGRGSRPSPDLPRGDAPDTGFVGSATVAASGPVLAVVQDEQMANGRVDSLSAYNAFGPDDLGSAFGVTSVRKSIGYQSTALLVYNPGNDPIEVKADLYDADEWPAGSATVRVAAHDLARLALAGHATFAPGVGEAVVTASGQFAALVFDERDERGEPLERSTTARISSIGESRTSGTARFQELPSGVRVDLQLGWTVETATYFAEIARGTCDGTRTTAHDLEDPVDRKSTTNLRGLQISDLTATPHCVVISVQGFGGRPPREVACGVIPPMPGPEVVDTTLSWPVRVEAGPPPASPTPQTAVPTATRTASATPDGTPGDLGEKAYLPIAHRW